jgi:hypothetical protein
MEDWQKNGKSILDLKKEVSSFFESKDNLPDFFKDVRPEQLEKKQPSVIESIQETLERFEMMEQLESVFEKPCKGIIVGGSLSYGPFYNVRAEKKDSGSSDIDAIFVLDQNSTDDDWEDFLRCPHFSEVDKQRFISRKNIFFESLLPNDEATILSQKFRLREKDYDISIHFFTDEALDDMLSNDIAKETDGDDRVVVLKDYKSKSLPHAVCSQTNFDGTPYDYIVPEQKSIDKGVITEIPAYIISNHKFHPGIYQNLVLPTFSVFHDRDGEITDKTLAFRENVETYIKNTYGEEGMEERMLKSHIRNKIFPETLGEQIRDWHSSQ